MLGLRCFLLDFHLNFRLKNVKMVNIVLFTSQLPYDMCLMYESYTADIYDLRVNIYTFYFVCHSLNECMHELLTN